MRQLLTVTAAAVAGLIATSASASAVLSSANGAVRIGINDTGDLNASAPGFGTTGIAYNFTGQGGRTGFQDALTPGCLCESWGVSGNGVGGAVGRANGNVGISFGSTSSGAGSFTSNTTLASVPGLGVTQAYSIAFESDTGALFKNSVTIRNTSASTITDIRYARAMDWDVPPTEFREYSTFVGTQTTDALLRSTTDGFAYADPMIAASNSGGAVNMDGSFGPTDHGALFVFEFGDLLAGGSYTFDIFYGAGANEADALGLLTLAQVELYNLGQSSLGGVRGIDLPTFMFAFRGVGGDIVVPVETPEPAALALLGMGVIGVAAARRRRA